MKFRLLLLAFLVVAGLQGCSKAPELSPLDRGKAQFHDGKWDEAIESLSEAIAKNPLDAEAYLYRGRAYHFSGPEHISQAIADFSEAIRISPKNYEAYYSRAQAYKERGERSKALADDMLARKLDPNYINANSVYAPTTAEEYQRAIERAKGKTEKKKPKEDDPSAVAKKTDADAPVEDIELLTRPILNPTKPTTEEASATPAPREGGSEVRDAYGMPLPKPQVGTVTEELFGHRLAQPSNGDEGAAGVLPQFPLGRSGRTLPPVADWQKQAPRSEPRPMNEGETAPARRPSPIGTLPFGNPYQPRAANPYSPLSPNSPFMPSGPRSTGIQSGTVNQPYPQSPYFNRRMDLNSVPSGQYPLR